MTEMEALKSPKEPVSGQEMEENGEVAVTSCMDKLKEARKRYTSTFTMHALEHIAHGNKVIICLYYGNWVPRLFGEKFVPKNSSPLPSFFSTIKIKRQ